MDRDPASKLARTSASPPAVTTTDTDAQQKPATAEQPLSSTDEITCRIRNPLLGPAPALPPATPTPVLAPRALPPPTPTPVLAPRSPRDDDATPEVVVDVDVSKNIHVFPIPAPPPELPGPSLPATSKRRGVIVVTTVILAGAAIDIFLWKTCGARPTPATSTTPAVIAHAAANVTVRPDGAGPGTRATSVGAPARSHVEIAVQGEGAILLLDGRLLEGNPVKLDVPSDPHPHLLEVTAPGFASFARSVSFAQDLHLVIELQRAPAAARRDPTRASPPLASPSRTPKPMRARPPPHRLDRSAGAVRAQSPRRPVSAIDETDPYAP